MKNSNALKPIRKKLGLTQQQVAQQLGVTQQTYSNYESGSRDISTAMIRKCVALFDCTADELLGLDTTYEFVDISDLDASARERVRGLIELEKNTGRAASNQ